MLTISSASRKNEILEKQSLFVEALFRLFEMDTIESLAEFVQEVLLEDGFCKEDA